MDIEDSDSVDSWISSYLSPDMYRYMDCTIADDQLPDISYIDPDKSTNVITEFLLNDEPTSDNPPPPSPQKHPFPTSVLPSFPTCNLTSSDIPSVKNPPIPVDNPLIGGSITVSTSENPSSPSPQRQPFPTPPKTPFPTTEKNVETITKRTGKRTNKKTNKRTTKTKKEQEGQASSNLSRYRQNKRERERRASLKDCQQELAALLRWKPNEKVTLQKILEKALKTIKKWENIHETLKQYRRRFAYLRSRLHGYEVPYAEKPVSIFIVVA
ncbi:hypothetical protein C0J52_13565 [Blattella germanica]|nr:hypothetical protein C0J52_13565 [Blattella germanica]